MSENEEPDRLAELARDSAALWRQMEPFIRGHEALWRQAEQALRGQEALRRKMEPIIIQAAEQFVRDAPWPKTGSLGLPLPLQLATAVDAAMRELKPAQLYAPAHPP